MKRSHQQSGFTLVEIMITLVIAAILLSLAVPNFKEFIEENRVTTATNSFVSDLLLIRSEAIKRGNNVTICTRNDAGTACDNSKTFNDGWIVVDAGGEVLRVSEPIESNLTITGNVLAANRLTYNASGFAPRGVFTLAIDGVNKRNIQVNATGRVSSCTITAPATSCS